MKYPIIVIGVLSLGLGACATTDRGYGYQDRGYSNNYASSNRCEACGVVERIDIARYGDGRASGTGAVVGAVVGAAIGNQVGSGDGRRAATVAGAVAGGVAGHRIEENRNERDRYAVVVRMDDGRRLVVEQRDLNGVREGARVVISNGRARLL